MKSSPPSWQHAVGDLAAGATSSGCQCPQPAHGSNSRSSHVLSRQGGVSGVSRSCAIAATQARAAAAAEEAWSLGMESPQLMRDVRFIVKNTFIDCAPDTHARIGGLNRSASDSDVSASSREELRFWVPALTSSSKDTSGDSGSNPDVSRTVRVPSLSSISAGIQDVASSGFAAEEPFCLLEAEASEPPLPEIPFEHLEDIRGQEFSSTCMEMPDALGTRRPGVADDQQIPTVVQRIHEETQIPIPDLLEAHAHRDLSLVPRHRTTGLLLSVGSISHDEGFCSPCMFHARKLCLKGVACLFCHIRHRNAKVRRIRPSKKRREKMKLSSNQAEAEPSPDSGTSSEDEVLVPASSSSQFAGVGVAEARCEGRNPLRPADQHSCRTMNDHPDAKLRL